MRVLPSGTAALLVEVDDLEQVLGLYAALVANPLEGVLDVVPASRTVLLATAPGADLRSLAGAVRSVTPRPGDRAAGDLVEIEVHYDGEDLADVAAILRCDVRDVVRRHVEEEWTVAFCGFAPGFGYLTGSRHTWDIPRRDTPRTRVPAGSVALAGEFTGVYPRESPGGWQLLGHTDVEVFDIDREPAALLRPGTRVRFVEAR